jgi:hypothetical protein
MVLFMRAARLLYINLSGARIAAIVFLVSEHRKSFNMILIR